MPTPAGFAQAFPAYRIMPARRAENRHHDYRRGLFLDLLGQAFGIRTDEIDVEQFVRIDMRRRGWIDARFRNLVFEFKRDLERRDPDPVSAMRSVIAAALPLGEVVRTQRLTREAVAGQIAAGVGTVGWAFRVFEAPKGLRT